MRPTGRHQRLVVVILLIFLSGCLNPPTAALPLSAAAAQQTLDRWNPQYCKVAEFYGFYKPEGTGEALVAYVLLANPSDAAQKQMVYEARFQLLTRADGRQEWFLTSLLSQAAGLSRRQGWDNLLIPVKPETSAAG